MFTTPDHNELFGYGNSGLWAQFYIEQENEYYYIASFHSVNVKNKLNEFGRYIGIDQNNLVSNLPRCIEARWIIAQEQSIENNVSPQIIIS